MVKFEIEGDPTVAEALRAIRPEVLHEGRGPREGKVACRPPRKRSAAEFDIEIIDGVGRDKIWSSTDFLVEWGEFWASRHDASLER